MVCVAVKHGVYWRRALLEGLTLKSVASCGVIPVTRTAGSRGSGISTKLVKLVLSISVSCSKAWSFSICTSHVKHYCLNAPVGNVHITGKNVTT